MTNGVTAAIQGMTWTFTTAGITAASSCITSILTGFALLSIFIMRKQLKSDHDRSRRECAVELMRCFATTPDPTDHKRVFGLALMNILTSDQCKSLWAKESFSIDAKCLHLLSAYRHACNGLSTGSESASKKKSDSSSSSTPSLIVSVVEAYTLRSIATSYLNRLELVASAWHHNVADGDMIETEFVKVFCPKDGIYVMETFRKVSGVYPSVERLCQHFEKKKNAALLRKPPTG